MTEKNRQNNIREELARSVAAMGAADLLNANGYHNEAVSRLYSVFCTESGPSCLRWIWSRAVTREPCACSPCIS